MLQNNHSVANTKGQITSKANCQDMNSSKKQTNVFVFTTSMGRVFVCFLEEIEVNKKTFRNYLTFNSQENFTKYIFELFLSD